MEGGDYGEQEVNTVLQTKRTFIRAISIIPTQKRVGMPSCCLLQGVLFGKGGMSFSTGGMLFSTGHVVKYRGKAICV